MNFSMTPEIRSFEYALGLFTILIGLAIADIALSVHRLVRQGQRVRWDALALMATLYAFLIAVGMWFDLWSIRGVAETRNYYFYLSIVGELFVVFLLAAASLPDDAKAGADLRHYYQENRRYFWSLVLLFQLSYYSHYTYFAITRPHPTVTHDAVIGAAVIGIAIIMLRVRSRLLHYAGLTVLIAVTLWDRATYTIN
jgi:hypothetical protein